MNYYKNKTTGLIKASPIEFTAPAKDKDGKVMLKFTLLNPNLEKEDFPPIISEIKKCRDKVKEEM